MNALLGSYYHRLVSLTITCSTNIFKHFFSISTGKWKVDTDFWDDILHLYITELPLIHQIEFQQTKKKKIPRY